MDRMLFSIMLHRELTLPARLDSSPEEYLRKKLTGRDRMRIITEACTAWEVLVLIRCIKRLRTRPISWAAKALVRRNTPTPAIRFILWPSRILPVTRLYTRGSIIPTSCTARVASTITTRSP